MDYRTIIMCGLPQTGKTTSSRLLESALDGASAYIVQYGKKFNGNRLDNKPSSYDIVNDRLMVALATSSQKIAIADGSYRSAEIRQKAYDSAAASNCGVVVLEHTCSEETSKRRMWEKNPTKTRKQIRLGYKMIAQRWENPESDLDTNPNVSLVRLNTELNQFQEVRVSPDARTLVDRIKIILLENPLAAIPSN